MKKFIVSSIILVISISAYFISQGYVPRIKERSIVRPSLLYELPDGLDSSYLQKLESLGINGSKELQIIKNVSKRKYWQKTFGLTFMGDDEIVKFLQDNDFIMGEASRYKESIPLEAGKKIIAAAANFKLKNERKYRVWIQSQPSSTRILFFSDFITDPDGLVSTNSIFLNIHGNIKESVIASNLMGGSDFYNITPETELEISKVFIIGNAKQFNTEGMQIKSNILTPPPPKDPIALIRVDGGYVEIANW